MTNEIFLMIFTAHVVRSVPNPHLSLNFYKAIQTEFFYSKKKWRDGDGLVTIVLVMNEHIKQNLHKFQIDSNLANKPY